MDQNQKNQEPEDMIEVLAFKGLDFGLAVSLLHNTKIISQDFIAALEFDQLVKIYRANIYFGRKLLIWDLMEKRASDFWHWKTLFDLTPRDESTISACENRDKIISKMKEKAGDDFDKLYTLFKLLNVCYEFREKVRCVKKEVENKICRDIHLTFDQCVQILNDTAPNNNLYDKAIQEISVYILDEFGQKT